MIFENSVPKANFGQNIRDSPNGSLTWFWRVQVCFLRLKRRDKKCLFVRSTVHISGSTGKSDKVKLMQVPWPQGRAQSGQNRSRIYFEGIKGSNGSVWCSCSCRSTWVFAYFLDYLLFEIIETHKQLAQIADIMNNLVYNFFKRSVVAVERRTV